MEQRESGFRIQESLTKQGGLKCHPLFTILYSQSGIALAMVLVLSLISLAVTASLVYLVMQGTKSSGLHKRYATSLEAGFGSAEILAALIRNQGYLVIPKPTSGFLVNFPKPTYPCDCGDPADFTDHTPDTCLCRKLCNPAYSEISGVIKYNWGSCSNSFADPYDVITNADFSVPLEGLGGTQYNAFVKIVDTSIGNTDLSGLNLGGKGVVQGGGTISAPPAPYLYSIEIDSQDATNGIEKARLSVLYAY